MWEISSWSWVKELSRQKTQFKETLNRYGVFQEKEEAEFKGNMNFETLDNKNNSNKASNI